MEPRDHARLRQAGDNARRLQLQAPIILLTAFASVATAVEAMKHGAYDHVTQPFNRDELKLVVARASRARAKIFAAPSLF